MIIRTASDHHPESDGPAPAPGKSHRYPPVWICVALLLFTGVVFSGTVRNGFVNYDDNEYAAANYHVQQGLGFETVVWAFFTGEASNWHPLTWLSHAADCDLYGVDKPGGYHLTNLLLHGLDTALVFLVLLRLTGAVWRSVFVAALFGVHPAHVESVAWISERKDVLSTLFLLLMLLAYIKYAGEVRGGGARRKFFFGLTLGLFALGLMSKPMLVTAPFLLLLLDYWPLGRGRGFHEPQTGNPSPRPSPHVERGKLPKGRGSGKCEHECLPSFDSPGGEGGESGVKNLEPVPNIRAGSGGQRASPSENSPLDHQGTGEEQAAGWKQLLIEKIPFFLASILSCLVTFLVQRQGGAMRGLAGLSMVARAENAVVSYCRYLGEWFFPARLAVYYPYPAAGHWPLAAVTGATVVLLAITGFAVILRNRFSYLAVGWFWFLGTLVPVIGLVQVGVQSMADRYMYIPSIGLLIAIVWGVGDLVEKNRAGRIAALAAGTIAVLACAVLTVRQVGYWKDGETLFRHVLAVTDDNCVPHYLLGDALFKKGRLDEATKEFQAAVTLKPNYADPHNDLGMILSQQGKRDEAIAEYNAAIKAQSDYPTAHYNLGLTFQAMGRLDEAIREFKEAIRLKPNDSDSHKSLAVALAGAGQRDQAIDELKRAASLNPRDEGTHVNLGILHGMKGEFEEAIREFQSAVAINPKSVEAHNYLGIALRGGALLDEAAAEFREALSLQPTSVPAHENLGDILERQGEFSLAAAQYDAAIRSSRQPAGDHYHLGMVLLKLKQREEALAHFREALRLQPDFPEAEKELRKLVPADGAGKK